MRILVTGGAGFLGSHLCDLLWGHGHEVICLDNLFTGSRSNIDHLVGRKGFEFMRHDVVDPITVEGVDQIYHLACPASPIHYQRNPVRTLRTAMLGTMNMLDMACEVGARILIASTSEIYGQPQVHPQREDYWGYANTWGPRSCYDEGKRADEALAWAFASQFGTEVRVARIHNTYGPRMHENDGRVVSNFIVQALRGEPLTVYGDGGQTRSLCYVSDLIEGLRLLMEYTEESPLGPGPVNLGNPNEMTILQLAKRVIDLTGSRSEIVYKELPVDDPVRRCPVIEKAETLLGWAPIVALDYGLRRTIEDFKRRF